MPSTRRSILRNLSYACLSVLAFFVMVAGSAASAQGEAAIAQGYKTSETNLGTGALMSLRAGNNNTVELANIGNVSRLIGVVGNNSLIELGNGTSNVQIVTGGVAKVLVSDANGTVNAGDKITASPIAGIGMRATSSVEVVGVAQASLSNATTKAETVTNTDGSQTVVHVAQMPVQINVSFFVAQSEQSSFVPGFLQDFANSVGGREVSPVRVLIAALVLLLAFLSIGVLLYSTVRSSIISIGRNPLSEKAVRKSIVQIGITVVGILLLSLITIYLILTT